MTSPPGATLDLRDQLQAALGTAYTLERELGGGGMSRVFVAQETGLGRVIVVKVLPRDAAEALSTERFKREIAVAARLQHPHIVPLLAAGEIGGIPYYTMPFVEGESLRGRLARDGELSVADAVSILRDVARALAYAHAHGVVHRDIKPDNVLLAGDAAVVTDFGVAKAVSAAATYGDRDTLTQLGVALGTPAYMAPEQAAAEPTVDHRADLYAFGCMAYETLTGQPPFTGRPTPALLAAQVAEAPEPITRRRPSIPPALAALVMQCLEKRPSDRPRDAQAVLQALQSSSIGAITPTGLVPATTAAGTLAPTQPYRSRTATPRVPSWIPWLVAMAAVIAAGIAFAAMRERPTRPAPTLRFTLPLGAGIATAPGPVWPQVAVSADGSRIVLVGFDVARGGAPALYTRTLDDPQLRRIAGTDGAMSAFVSPDGTMVGFFHDNRLMKVPAAGGVPDLITQIPHITRFGGAAWGPSGVIVFSQGVSPILWRVSSAGGDPRPLTTLDAAHGDVADVAPAFTPDGKLVVFTRRAVGTPLRVEVTDLDGHVTPLVQGGTMPQFVDPSHLVFVRSNGTVSAATFDPRTRSLTGPVVNVLDGIDTRGAFADLAASAGGTAVYLQGGATGRLAVVSPGGGVRILPGESHQIRHVRVSPDGTRIVAEIQSADSRDIWTYDLASGALTRVTFDGRSSDPVWSPDGRRITFAREEPRDIATDIYTVPADGTGAPTLLVGGPGSQWPAAWAPDGRAFYYDEITGTTPMHVSALDATGHTRTVVASAFGDRLAAVSPDGRWLAYTSAETGRTEVYVRPTASDGKWMVSTDGGTQPVWSRDGRTLYYRDGTQIMAAEVATSPSFTVLQRSPYASDRFVVENTINYDALPNGKGLVAIVPDTTGLAYTVVVNWATELTRRLAAASGR